MIHSEATQTQITLTYCKESLCKSFTIILIPIHIDFFLKIFKTPYTKNYEISNDQFDLNEFSH